MAARTPGGRVRVARRRPRVPGVRQPLNNIQHIEAPLLVLHGENDPRVPVGEAEQIAEEAAEQGVPVEKFVFPDEGHGFSKLENRIEAYTKIAEFLQKYV